MRISMHVIMAIIRISEWDEAHKAPVTRMAIFQPGIFYLENYWVS
jgi:hypothetical protein